MKLTEPESAYMNQCHLVVFDDLSSSLQNSDSGLHILEHFRVFEHHKSLVCVYICQNVFDNSRFQRSLSLNANYLVLFRNLRDQNQVGTVAKQVYGDRKKFFMRVYKKIMFSGSRFNHIVIDLHPCSWHPLSVHTNILSTDSVNYEDLEKIFVLKPN